jgi:hypothetical protein
MKLDFKTMFGKKKGTAKRHAAHPGGPRRDWTVLLAVFAVVIVGLLAINIKIFTDVNRGDFFVPGKSEDGDSERLDRAAIDAVTADFAEKARRHADLMASKPVFADPSN